MKVAHAAEGFGLDCEFHGGGLAHRHCIAAIRNTNYYELGLLHPLVKNTKPPVYPPNSPTSWKTSMPKATCPCRRGRVWAWRWIGITLKDTSAARRCLSKFLTVTHLFHRKIGEYPCSDVPTVPLANTFL